MACILGNGTNFGLYKIANISDRSFNDLRATQANYLRLETLRAANDVISNKTASLPIFEYYQIDERGQHGSIDGQKFECRFSSLMARYSPKYFGQEKGVSAITLVLNHIPANCVIHYNAQILSELKEFNEHEGRSENLEALKRISPVAWFHINFSGSYSFAGSKNSHDFSALARTVHLEA